MELTKKDRVRFWSHVDVRGPAECWIWQAHIDSWGRGRFAIKSASTTASRVAVVAAGREIPEGLHVLHHCDVPACVNPGHLYCGTPADNSRDCVERGRLRVLRAEANGNARLTNADVLEVRNLLASNATHRQIAARFGVSRSAIAMISNGTNWRSVR